MSKSVAFESHNYNESREMSGKRGAGYEEKQNKEGILEDAAADLSTTSSMVSTVPAATDQFMFTPEFRRHFVDYVPGDMLMTLRLETKGWKAAADAFIDEVVRSGEFIVHGGEDTSWSFPDPREERRKLVTRVISF